MLSRITRIIRTRVVVSVVLCMGAAAAYADVVVVVGVKSGIKTLTKEQVAGVYLAKKPYTCADGDDLLPLDLASADPLRNEFYTKVTGRSAAQLEAYWPDAMLSGLKSPRLVAYADIDVVKRMLNQNPDYIAYISKKAVDSSVRIVFAP